MAEEASHTERASMQQILAKSVPQLLSDEQKYEQH
jgi:hypothetical protein